jgi:hypothetical protein
VLRPPRRRPARTGLRRPARHRGRPGPPRPLRSPRELRGGGAGLAQGDRGAAGHTGSAARDRHPIM